MLIKPSLKQHLIDHSTYGIWSGETKNGIPMITTHLGVVPAEPYLLQLGIVLKQTNKYKGIEKHEDMGQPQSTGHSAVTGDGDGESAE
jgi:hypothetical protein